MSRQKHNEGIRSFLKDIANNLFEFGTSGKQLPQLENFGTAIFVDGDTGSDSNDGLSWTNAMLTIDAAIAKTTDETGDYIFVGESSYNENANVGGVLVDVIGIHIIGMGGDLCQIQNDNVGATAVFTISVDSIELIGFFLIEATNTCEGIVVFSGTVGQGYFIHSNTMYGTMENGIRIQIPSLASSVASIVTNNYIRNVINDGIEIATGSHSCIITGNYIHGVGDNGIHATGAGDMEAIIEFNRINGDNSTTDYAINLESNLNFINNNWMGELGTAPTNDIGSNNSWIDNEFDEITGSLNILVADGIAETNKITNQDLPTNGLYEFQADVSSLETANEGGTISMFGFVKIDNTNLRKIDVDTYLEATDVIHPSMRFGCKGGDSVMQVASQVSIAVTATRAVPWKLTLVS